MGQRVATFIVGLFLLIMAAVPAGAYAASADRGQSDLSSLPAIEAYLTSIGVDPGSVVIQQGPLNYAGPLCPGDGWNCTAATRVVQIASSASPAANIFDCLPSLNALIPALNECLVVQSSVLDPLETSSSMNSASCNTDLNDGSGKSKCTIRQQAKKGNNNANVNQRINQRGGSPQTATEDAEINQTSDTGNNTAKISQTIQQTLDIDPTTPVNQKQQARQTAKVTQNSGVGNNSSDVQQTMLQSESAQSSGNITQEQNTDTTLGRNQQVTVIQTSTAGGTNTSNLQGQITQQQSADCSVCMVSQTESSNFGGQTGSVTQSATSSAVNKSIASQSENQSQHTSTTGAKIQLHVGPEDCCATQMGGGEGNINTITQANVQQNDTGLTSQTSEQNGHCTESGTAGASCSVDQSYTSNSGTNHQPVQSGPFVMSDRFCTDSGEGASCGGP